MLFNIIRVLSAILILCKDLCLSDVCLHIIIYKFKPTTIQYCESFHKRALTVTTWWLVCLHLWHLSAISGWSLPLFLREAPPRRPAPAAATPPCLRSTPLLPPTPLQVKVRQHPRADSHLLILALHMPVQSTPNTPNSESIRALSSTGRRLWRPVTR